MQLIYEEINGSLGGVVDRLENLSRELPPAGEQFRNDLAAATAELTSATQHAAYYFAHIEKNLGRSIAEEFARGAKSAAYNFKLEASNYTSTGLPQEVAKVLAPQLVKASADGLEALKEAKTELADVREDVSFHSKANMVLIMVLTIFTLLAGIGLGWLMFAPHDFGKADRVAVYRDGLFLEDIWPLLAPNARKELVRIHDAAVLPSTK